MEILSRELGKANQLSNKQVLDYLGGKPLNIEEVRNLIAYKADRTEIGILDQSKTEKYETENLKDLIRTINTQNEHFLTLVIESLKVEIDSQNDSGHTQINKKASLLSQLINLYNWSKKKEYKNSGNNPPNFRAPKSSKSKIYFDP